MASSQSSRAPGLILGLGLLLAPFKLLYSFFPLFNVLDLIVFAIAGLAVGRRGAHWALAALLVSVPSMALASYFLVRLGPDQLRHGIGVGWLISLAAMPAAALVGSYWRRPDRPSGDAA